MLDTSNRIEPDWSDPDAAVEFLRALRPKGPWALTALYPDPDAKRVGGDTGPAPTRTFTDATKAKAWIAARSGKANLHFHVNRIGLISRKASEADVEAVEFLHVDIDEDSQGPIDGDPTRKAAVIERLRAFRDTPTFIIDSGGGVQVLWRIAPEKTAAGKQICKAVNRALIRQFGGDKTTFNLDRVLRLPATVNIPGAGKRSRGRTPLPTTLMEANENTYEPWMFEQTEVSAEAPETRHIEIGAPEYTEDLEALAEKHNLPDTLVRMIRDGSLPEGKKGDDSPSGWLHATVTELVRSRVPYEIITGLLTDSSWEIANRSVFHKHEGDEALSYAERQVRQIAADLAPDLRVEFPDDVDEILAHYNVEAVTATRGGKFKRWDVRELLKLPPPAWILEGILLERCFALLYGEPKSMKTFTSLAMALSISQGKPFLGRETRRGTVTYVAAEGHERETAERVLAWCKINGVKLDHLAETFKLVVHGVRLDDPDSVAEYLAEADDDMKECDYQVFDTLNRNMGGHENDPYDMSRVVEGVDRIRRICRGAVMVVHHTGVNSARERGSTVLRGAVDTRIRITATKPEDEGAEKRVQTMTIEDVRSGPDGWSLYLKPKVVVVDPDELRDSLAMIEAEAPREKATKAPKEKEVHLSAGQVNALLAIAERKGIQRASEIRNDKVEGLSRANVYGAVEALRGRGLIMGDGSGPITLTEKGEEVALKHGAAIPA